MKKTDYWFRPKKFWRCFACYYPTSTWGMLSTLLILVTLWTVLILIDARSHSVSDTLINFVPWVLAGMAIFDLLCFRCGEYPSWWKKFKD